MGLKEFFSNLGSSVSGDSEEGSDKYLEYLRGQERLRQEGIEKQVLKKRLLDNQKRRFNKSMKDSMITGKFKNKNFDLKLK